MSDPKQPQNMMRYAGLATQWMVMLGLATYGGYKLDDALNWKFPLFLILFPLLALGFSLWQLIKELNKPGK
ncbi:MAG: ATPase [Flavipsychrobacter sp.]|nr:ATPase [Flavipsychrobacter sp.]